MTSGEKTMTNEREQRGALIAATCKLVRKGNVWLVPSQSRKGKYTVCPDKETPHCTCADHETRACECKHIYAVRFVIQRELFDDGTIQETATVTVAHTVRKTYKQDWPAYNAAQKCEKQRFQVMLHDLCQSIPEPPANPQGGRPSVPIRDAIFSACFKVYSTVSGRRFTTDLQAALDSGHIGRAPSYNTLFRVFESPETFDILRALVTVSASPLKAIESNFACDSSGFTGCRYDRWIEHKYGSPTHVMVGVKTNIVTAVEIFDKDANDGVQLPKLLNTTTKQFTVKELSADLAYSFEKNLWAVDAVGAAPLIPFKSNASPAKGGLWAKMFHYFQIHREEFLSRYHQRSNVESTFSMIKRKFGDSVRSKTDVAMKNEVLAKLVCHNICCVNQEAFELGIDPGFGAETPVASIPTAG
jgi:transposase